MKKSITKAAMLVVLLEIIMKIFAFVKQAVVAYYFGANGQTDVYFVANDFMVSVSETLVSAAKIAVISVYTAICVMEGKKEGDKLLSGFFVLMICFAIVIVITVNVFSVPLANVLAPFFSNVQNSQLQIYISKLSGIVMFTSIIMIMEAVMNSNEVFVVARIRSFIYSGCVICACIIASQQGIGVLINAQYSSFFIYMIILIIAVRPYYKFSFCNPWTNRHINEVVKIMLPALIGNSIVRINYLVDKAVASSVVDGGVSALAYCQTLDQFVVVVIINSICSIMFAHFANLVAEGKKSEIDDRIDNVLCALTLILVPVTLVVCMSSENIVQIVFGRGKYETKMIGITASALVGYSIRYLFVGIRDVVIQVLYAYHETKAPMMNSVVCTIINVIVSVCGVKKYGILAIAIGTSISAFVGMLLNIKRFLRYNKTYSFEHLIKIIIHGIPGGIFAICGCWWINHLEGLNSLICFIVKTFVVFGGFYISLLVSKDSKTIFFLKKIRYMLNCSESF